MKPPSILIALVLVFSANAKAQDGNGRLFETLLRGLAHVVASENGSPLVPPPIPYDPHAGHAQQQKPVSNHQHQGSQNRNWFQPAPPQARPRAVNPTPQPRVIRQPAPQPQQPSSPFAGWYQAPQPQPQVQYHRPAPPTRVVPAPPAPGPPLGDFNPFEHLAQRAQQVPDYHDHQGHRDHGSHQSSQPGFFGQRQPQQPSRHSRDNHHDHHGHGSHQQREPSRVIAIRSQFQPFTIFQGQQNQTVISSRSVRPVPNQGSVVWFRTR